ncbi:MAG: PBP1A family penicillin-binding protein [Alphaproteobacteria bacterium]|nr:PBP1A family penicillin-binding protein [Alphaproteobacteria bacterium]
MKDEDIYEKASRLSRKDNANLEDFATQRNARSFEKGKDSGFFAFILRIILYTVCSFFAIAGVGVASLIVILYFFCSDLPNHDNLKNCNPTAATKVFLQDGAQLCEYSSEKRYFVPIELIPQKVINSFIAVEDKHFYQHAGIDFFGIARSLITNFKRIGSGKRPQGASTITQQVARIFLIKSNEISYLRKIKEAILAYRIESALSKSRILELYLNQIYLGLGSYGVAAAAKTYFGKTIDELSISESAYLAILAKGANNYHPVKNKERAINRRNWALGRLLDDGYISEEEYKISIKEELQIVTQHRNDYLAEYFSEEIRKDLKSKYPSGHINNEGLVVRATLDSRFQKCAYFALKRGLETVDRGFGWRGPVGRIDVNQSKDIVISSLKAVQFPKGGEKFIRAVVTDTKGKAITETEKNIHIASVDLRWAKDLKSGDVVLIEIEDNKYRLRQVPKVQGAIVVMDVHNGRILAMQGGYSFAQSEFNRVTQAKRQIGSAFKPFVYLAGLVNGFAPNTIIDASPVEIDLGPQLGIWKPRNYRDAVLDKITFRQALEKSVNTATVRIAQEVGMKKIAELAEKFDLFENMPQYLSFALGAGEATLMQLVTAYSMFANGGKKIEPTLIDYIQDIHGKLIYKADARTAILSDNEEAPRLNDIRSQIEDERSIYQLTSLLEGVIQRGSGVPARFLGFPIAGKTGTSNESKDTWFIGYTPDIAVGVFVGFDDHLKSLGKNASGTATALPIFVDFMKHAKKYLTPKPFRVPNGIKLRQIDLETGGAPREKTTIWESLKYDEATSLSVDIDPLKNPISSSKKDTEEERQNEETSDLKDGQNDEAIQLFGVY